MKTNYYKPTLNRILPISIISLSLFIALTTTVTNANTNLFTEESQKLHKLWENGATKFTNHSKDQLLKMINKFHPVSKNDQAHLHFFSFLSSDNKKQSEGVLGLDLPLNFNWREARQGCMVPSLDQGECGSCYAYTTAAMLAEKLCIQNNHTQAVPLSPAYIMSCDPYADGCNGGVVPQVIDYLLEEGIPSNECMNYYNSSFETCPNQCIKQQPSSVEQNQFLQIQRDQFDYKVKCKVGSKRQLLSIDEMKQEIYQNGPVASSMIIYDDLVAYRSGVYHYDGDSMIIGSHAILIVGWGFDPQQNLQYWEVQNSWGSDWGEHQGYFRIKMGESEIASELFGGAHACDPEIQNNKITEVFQ
eukprot:403348455